MDESGPETLLVGTVYTMDPRQPVAESVLVRGARIACVGPMRECNERAKPGATRLSVGVGSITPGLVDASADVLPYGRALRLVSCDGARSEEECIARVEERARSVPAGDWILGRGWDERRWVGGEMPRERGLSFTVKQHPVLLERFDGTATWANEAALEAAGVDAYTPDPAGGRILRYGDGRPSGVLVDAAQELVREVVAPPSPEERMAALEEALRELATLGLTGVHDLGVGTEAFELYRKLAVAKRLPIRVHAVLDGGLPAPELDKLLLAAEGLGTGGRLDARAVLLRLDGEVASGTAMLLEPYAAGGNGKLAIAPDDLRARIRALHARGFQPVIHAAGDAAVREALAAVADVRKELGENAKALRVRLDGVELFDGGEGRVMKELGAAVTVRPGDVLRAPDALAKRVGAQRKAALHPWREVVKFAVPLALGSGLPEQSPDPRALLSSAELRRPEGAREAFVAEQRLERIDALRGLTVRSAYAARADERRGMLREGYDADLTLLGADLLGVAPGKLRDVPVLGAMVGGEFAFRAPEGLLTPGGRKPGAVAP